jgi:hypothetical protein
MTTVQNLEVISNKFKVDRFCTYVIDSSKEENDDDDDDNL